MSEINVNFMHPIYGTTLAVDIEDTVAVKDVLEMLLQSGFIPNDEYKNYQLAFGDSGALDERMTLRDIGVEDGSVIRIMIEKKVKEDTEDRYLLHFIHPKKGVKLNLHVARSMTLEQAFRIIYQRGFVLPRPLGYHLMTRTGEPLPMQQTFEQSKLEDGDFVHIIPIEQEIIAEEPTDSPEVVLLTKLFQRIELLEEKLNRMPEKHELETILQAPPGTPQSEPYEDIHSLLKDLKNFK